MVGVFDNRIGDGGDDVCARNVSREHYNTINNVGLRIEGASGDRTVRLNATTSPADAGECDLVIIATKAEGVEGAAKSLDPLLRDDTMIMTIQNGLGAAERISRFRAPDNILIGVAGGFGAAMRGPGHAFHNGMQQIRIGEMNGGLSERVEDVGSQPGLSADHHGDAARRDDRTGRRRDRRDAACMCRHVSCPCGGQFRDHHGRRALGDQPRSGRNAGDQRADLGHVRHPRGRHLANDYRGRAGRQDRQRQSGVRNRCRSRRRRMDRRMTMRRLL